MRRPVALLLVLISCAAAGNAAAQEARRRWEMLRQIRLDKFEYVLPVAMRTHGIDMWIVAVKENHYDPLWEDLGRGYISGIGYYVFTDRGGDRIERAALGPDGYLIDQSGAYDVFAPASSLATFVKERNPKRIGVNMSEQIGPADGLSHTMHQHLVKTLGEPYASRLVSAERVVSDFRSRRVASEIVAFGEAAGIAIQLAERALSNEVITPGRTTLEDVAWWMQDRLLEKGLGSEFDMPSVYTTGPDGIIATSTDLVIQPGMVLMIDWGVQLMNFGTDVKRVAYVLKPGEVKPPASIQAAFDKALAIRAVAKKHLKVGVRADEAMKNINDALKAAGYGVIEFNKPTPGPSTDVVIGFHPVGNTGHDIGASLTTWQPLQATFPILANHMFSFEYFAYTPLPEWGGKKLRIPIEDDALVTERGVEFLHSANYRLLVIK
jgi:Xaa-Pro aminopeptidase